MAKSTVVQGQVLEFVHLYKDQQACSIREHLNMTSDGFFCIFDLPTYLLAEIISQFGFRSYTSQRFGDLFSFRLVWQYKSETI